jgi:hypothetical protein
VLKRAGISWQSTKTWKHSTDAEFAAKKARILHLYDRAPENARVICIDLCRHGDYAEERGGSTRGRLAFLAVPRDQSGQLGTVAGREKPRLWEHGAPARRRSRWERRGERPGFRVRRSRVTGLG